MKTPFPIHSFLAAVFPVLFLFAHNAERFSINVLLLPLGLAAALGLVWYFFLRIVVGEATRAGILASVSLLLFFSYGHLLNLLAGARIALGPLDLGPNRILFLLFGAVFLVAVLAVARKGKSYRVATIYLNAVAGLLIVFSLLNIGIHALRDTSPEATDSSRAAIELPGAAIESIDTLPDIYYIILDGYGRADVLNDIYQYDNSAFLDFLTRHGFYVAEKSCSNYDQTILSLTSSLNLRHLHDLAAKLGVESNNRRPLRRMIHDSQVRKFLARYGYRFVAFATGYAATEIRSADLYLAPRWSMNEFQNALLTTTPLPAILKVLGRSSQHESHRERLLFAFEHLADRFPGEGPVFVFAHVVAPHPPFVFGPNGEAVRTAGIYTMADGTDLVDCKEITSEDYAGLYRDQLIFINSQVQVAIDAIIAGAMRPTVIILQGDHGPGSRLDWEDVEATDVKERMTILNAYYFSDRDDTGLYEEITPVNSFRTIFNLYFDAGYERLPDRIYFSTSSHPYDLIDVTERVRTDARP